MGLLYEHGKKRILIFLRMNSNSCPMKWKCTFLFSSCFGICDEGGGFCLKKMEVCVCVCVCNASVKVGIKIKSIKNALLFDCFFTAKCVSEVHKDD